MLMLKELDSGGVALRKRHKLQRRIYISKVSGHLILILMIYNLTLHVLCYF